MAEPIGFLGHWTDEMTDAGSPLIYQVFQRHWIERDRQGMNKVVSVHESGVAGVIPANNGLWLTGSTFDVYVPKGTNALRFFGFIDATGFTTPTDNGKIRFEINTASGDYTAESGTVFKTTGPETLSFDVSRDISSDGTAATRVRTRLQYNCTVSASGNFAIRLDVILLAYTTDDLN